MLDDLLWRPYPGGSCSRSPVYRSPSWSWASIDGPVWYHERKEWQNMSHAVVEEINVESRHPEIRESFIVIQGSLLDIPSPIEPPHGLDVICATMTWNPLESNSFTTVPARSSATIDMLLDFQEDSSIHAHFNAAIILNIQMQSKEHHNNWAGFDKCRAVGLLLRRSGHGLNTSWQRFQGLATSSPEIFGVFERIGVFESEWLDMWTLQQLCTCTRRERIKII